MSNAPKTAEEMLIQAIETVQDQLARQRAMGASKRAIAKTQTDLEALRARQRKAIAQAGGHPATCAAQVGGYCDCHKAWD